MIRMLETNGYLEGGCDGLGDAIALFLSDRIPQEEREAAWGERVASEEEWAERAAAFLKHKLREC